MPFIRKADVERLKEVRLFCQMKPGSFDAYNPGPVTIPVGGVTDFIREETQLWRETWILGPLDDILRALGPS